MPEINKIKLTSLQEKILLEFNKTSNYPFICKKHNIKHITLVKIIQSLKNKGLLENNTITKKGKELINYLRFRNETVSSFLKMNNIPKTPTIEKQLNSLDIKIIVAIKNVLN